MRNYWFWQRVKDIVQPRLQRAICVMVGHLPVARQGLWYVQRQFLPGEVEAICIRCGHRYCFMKDLEDSVFAESPFETALRARYSTSVRPKEGDSQP